MNPNEDLMCLGGPLHGRLRERGHLLKFETMVTKKISATEDIAEPHVYILSTFHYATDGQAQYWRHKHLDSAGAANFIMLDFLLNRPTLKIGRLAAALKTIEALAKMGPMVSSQQLAEIIVPVFYPGQAQKLAALHNKGETKQ